MNDKVRKTLPLVGALALTSSALLAGTGAALAGKPDPKIDVNGARCVASGADFRYYATIDMSSNKGKWVFVEAKLHDGDNVLASRSYGKVEKTLRTVEFQGDGTTATITVEVLSRKGDVLVAVTTDPLSCPVGA